MGTKNCRKCGALMDAREPLCLECRTIQKSGRGSGAVLLFVAFLLFIMYLGVTGNGNVDKGSDVTEPAPDMAGDAPAEREEPGDISFLYVTVGELNVRMAPSTTATVTNVLYRGGMVAVLEEQQGWARISEYYDGGGEGKSGQVARWVSARYLSEERTVSPVPNPSSRLEVAIDGSDDYHWYRKEFLQLSGQLLDSGRCSIEYFEKWGGWIRSVNYKPRYIYFTYCGRAHLDDRIYLNPVNLTVFQSDR